MGGQFGGLVSQQSGHHLQPDPTVQTAGRIGVSGHVGENGFVDAADVPDGFQINIEPVISDEGKSEVVFLQDLDPFFQNDRGITDPRFPSGVVNVVPVGGLTLSRQ